MVRDGWRKLEFAEIAYLRKDKFNPSERNVSFPCIELEHIQKETGRVLGYVSSDKQESTKNRFYPGDVLFGKLRPNLRKYAMVDYEGVCSSEIWVFKPTDEVTQEYLFSIIQQESFIQAACVTTGSKMPRADWNYVSEIPFFVPPKDEQGKITDKLKAWYQAIEKTEKLIEAKEKHRRRLAHKLLFGKARTGKRRTVGLLEKPWFLIPNDWRIVKIGSVAREVSTKNQNGGKLPVLSCTKYQGLVDSLKYFDKQIFSKDTSTYKVVDHGQFAYATNHIEEGSIGYQNLYPKGLVSPMYTVFETDKKQVNDSYLYKLLKTETFRHIFEINTSASVDRRGSLRWNEFSKLPLPLPNLDEQTEINTVLEIAQRESELLRQKLELLKKQKRGLMQKLLTGEWRVKAG